VGGGWVFLKKADCLLLSIPPISGLKMLAGSTLTATPFGLPLLFLTFLKIGAMLYGRGYVLLAFLRADLVVRFGWLTDQQLLDAIAIGQVTPGPVFTTASLGLMAAVTLQLGRASLIDPPTLITGLVALILLIKTKINPTWLIAVGALIGTLRGTLV